LKTKGTSDIGPGMICVGTKRFFIAIFCLMAVGCQETPTPKPKGYFRIELPKKESATYSSNPCPFSFQIPSYSQMLPYRDSIAEPCWKYLRFPQFNCEVFLSYKKIDGNLRNLMEDSRTLVYKHTLKANAIEETEFRMPGRGFGVLYDIKGNAASPIQFYVSDSSKHFLRGALYFNVAPQPDSLAPVIDFVREDIVRLMETIQWSAN
jgi:gliding motility-associated lipoprotein GldD